MSNTARNAYIAALRANMDIKKPTVDQVWALCPHLTREQVIDNVMKRQHRQVALPPIAVENCFHIAYYYPGSRTYDPRFSVMPIVQCVMPSYFGGMHADVGDGTYPFADEAMAYAKTNWPEELIWDNWEDCLTICIQDPTESLQVSSVRTVRQTKFVVSMGLRRGWGDLRNDDSKPQVELWNDAISVMTIDPLVGEEFKGTRDGWRQYNCAYCGGALDIRHCNGCGATFPNDYFHSDWEVPLPRKLIELLREHGHVFGLDPERLLVR